MDHKVGATVCVMGRRLDSFPIIYYWLGRSFFALGMVLGVYVFIHLVRETVDTRIAAQPHYLLIASTPQLDLPPATPLPTFTPTPWPTAAPPPPPAIRLAIPAIRLNSAIEEVTASLINPQNQELGTVWQTVAFAVGHYDTSGNPGEGRNIVVAGHNNTLGEVFRDLNKLTPGDEVILYTQDREFHYLVEKKYIIPFLGQETDADAKLRALTAPQTSERVTLISCWPYATNASRIIVIAGPTTAGK